MTSVPEPDRIALAALPTPLVRLERVSRALGGAVVWMKRDDLSGLELSGNKVRKLEYIAADALASGCDTLVTEGTPQSNHCRATAAVSAKLGLKAVLLLRPVPPSGLPRGNHLLDTLFGAELRAFPKEAFVARREAIYAETVAGLRAQGRNPRITPIGASEPLGCWGYIRAMRELDAQLQAVGIEECDLVIAVSSGGTYAGAVVGVAAQELKTSIHVQGVLVSDDLEYQRRTQSALIRATLDEFRIPLREAPHLELIEGFVGEGYGIPTPAGLEALRQLARLEAILLDPVYTAKAFAALLAGVRECRFGFDRPVVFLHTGGVFSDFAWTDVLLGE